MEKAVESIRIRSEDDAWRHMEQVVQGELPEGCTAIEFEGWPSLKLHLTGPKFHGTLTTSVMESLIDLQKNLNRSYASLRYNKSDARCLTDEDHDQIELVVKVKEGSSEIEAALANALEKIAVTVADKMEPIHFVGTILGFALLYFGHSYAKARLDGQIKEKQISADSLARENDTARYAMLVKAVAANPVLKPIREDAEDAHASLLKAAATAESANIFGAEIPGETAAELGLVKRERAKDVRLDGTYRIVVADNSVPSDPRCRLISDDREAFSAMIVSENWTPPEHALFQQAFWSGSPINLKINAKTLRGQISFATVVGVVVPAKDIEDE